MNCPTCHTLNRDDARFCSGCGSPLAAPRPAEGERRYLTLLFADVVGSTALAEQLDPEEWTELMNGAFGFLIAAVRRYGGTVGRLMGDGILAFFGAPTAHEDDPERAVLAGLEIRDAAVAYGREVQRRHGLPFEVRVGINSGLAVLATVGDATAAEYTAMGDSANVAARLQGLARANSVLIGADTYASVRHLVEVEARDTVHIRGRAVAVAAYEVLGARGHGPRVRGADGLRSPLVGREVEVEAIRERLGDLRAGRGSCIAIVGEAGIGKSRLVAELRDSAAAQGVRWLEGRGISYAEGVHYFPWRQLILAAIGAGEAEPPESVRPKLHRALGTLGHGADEGLPFLEAVLAVESDDSGRALADHDAAMLAPRIAEAIRSFVGALSSARPTVVVFEDLHWADQSSTELIVDASDLVESQPLLLICVSRPETAAPSPTLRERLRERLATRLVELELRPLDGEHTRRLLDNLMPVERLPQAVREAILAKTDGNPFFIEEVIRSLIDAGAVVRDGDRWRVTADLADMTIPDTLIGVLSARIDRLPEATRRVAQTAAVIGRAFAFTVLDAVFELSPEPERVGDLAPHLGRLSAEQLVRQRARDRDLEYVFKHALTREAAYARLLLRRRKELHRRTGQVLERLHGEQRDDVAPVLAYHFTLGEEWLKAARYGMRAGERALKLYALRDALERYDAALAALDRVATAAPEVVVDAVIGWVESAVALRQHEQPELRPAMHERLRRAIGLARAVGDKRRLTQLLVAEGNVYALSGFPDTGFPALLEAHDLARELEDDHLFVMPYWAATESLLNRDPRGAAEQFERVIELARRARNRAIEAHALASKAVAHARLGEGGAARAALEQALAIAPLANSIIKEADVNILAGAALHDLGEIERGLEFSRIGTEQAFSVSGFECACGGYWQTGLGRLATRQVEAARRDFGQSIALGTGTRMERQLYVVRGADAQARFEAGDDGAVGQLEIELESAERAGDEYGIGTLAQALAQAYLRLGRPQLARAHLGRALAIFRTHGMRPYLARALATEAALLGDQGRSEEAEAARTEAERIALEMRALDHPTAFAGATPIGAGSRVPQAAS
jgi:class 3 adenylate cyclase/tetratricopeptide (TPR) repeat protein